MECSEILHLEVVNDNKNWLLRESMSMGKSKVKSEKIYKGINCEEGDSVRPFSLRD